MKRRMVQMMPISYALVLITLLLISCKNEVRVTSTEALLAAIADPPESGIIHLESGTYELSPVSILDSSCANCQDPSEPVPATAALILTGSRLHLIGPEDHSARILTHAGYGIFFRNCRDGMLQNLTITGGSRDTDPRASSAAVVVKDSRVKIVNNIIRDNIGDSALVAEHIVGVIGIAGREGSDMEITGNQIIRNSWDAIDRKSVV